MTLQRRVEALEWITKGTRHMCPACRDQLIISSGIGAKELLRCPACGSAGVPHFAAAMEEFAKASGTVPRTVAEITERFPLPPAPRVIPVVFW